MQDVAALLPIVAIALLFWLLIVRPASRRQAKMRQLQNTMTVGSRVLLAAGLFGTVREVADDRVDLEIADGVVVTVAKASVVQILDDEREVIPETEGADADVNDAPTDAPTDEGVDLGKRPAADSDGPVAEGGR